MIWLMATEQGQRGADGVTRQRVRRARRQMWALVVGVPLVLVAACFALFASGVSLPGLSSGEPPAWREGLGFAISAVGFAIAGVGIYRMIRGGIYSARNRAEMTSFTREQRREAVRLVRQGEPAPQDAMPAATATARSLARQHRALPLYVGIALNGLGTALRFANPGWLTLMALGLIALIVVAIPFISRDARMAQRWLDAQPQQTADEAAGA